MTLEPTNRQRRRIGPNAWRQVETYECPKSEAETHETALWARVPEGYSGRSTPVCQSVELRYRDIYVDRSRLTATFQTPTWDEFLLRNPNHFVIHGRGSVTGELVKTDLDGYTIAGIDPTDPAGTTIWKVIEGANAVFRPKATYVVRGIVTNRLTWFDQYTDHLGQVNSNSCSHFGNHQSPGELLFTAVTMDPHPTEDDRWRLAYYFMGKDGGWNDGTVSRMYEKKVAQVPILDAAGEETGNTKDVGVLVPTATTRIAYLFESTSLFGLLNNEIYW